MISPFPSSLRAYVSVGACTQLSCSISQALLDGLTLPFATALNAREHFVNHRGQHWQNADCCPQHILRELQLQLQKFCSQDDTACCI